MDNLKKPEVLLIFSYAPAGLGHLRVTDALYDGLEKEINSVLLGAEDTKITYWHRLTSISPLLKGIYDWLIAKGRGEKFFDLYANSLRKNTKNLYQQMENLVKQQWQEKKTVVVVATHFGLAHQLAAIKPELEKNLKIRLILVVQVTDATSIEIWYVPEADLMVVPSDKVKKELTEYAKKKDLRQARIETLPYPLGQGLQERLDEKEFESRLRQYRADSQAKIEVAIPISGAAVGMSYYEKLTTKMARGSDRFRFWVVVRNNLHTQGFIRKMKARDYVTVLDDSNDKRVIDDYEKVYQKEVIGFEIVKPSEQAFKGLLMPRQRGGAILLFNEPVGRQEVDNLNFLISHQLLPSDEEQVELVRAAAEGRKWQDRDKAFGWRGIRLTDEPGKDAALISWGIESGLFEQMAQRKKRGGDKELQSNGVEQLWQTVDKLAGNKN